MGHCFSKKLLPPELNTDTSSESSENSEDSEKESVKKDGGSVKVNKSTKKPTKISSKNPNVGKTAAFSKSDPVKSTKGGTKLSPKKITAVSGSSKPSASSKQTSSPSTKPGGSKASSKSSPSPGGIGGKAKATVAAASAASKSSKTPPPPPSTFRIPPKATTAVEMKRNKTPNVVARVAPQSTAKNPEPVQQAPPPPPPPQPPPQPFQTPVEQPKIEQIKTEFLSEQSYSEAMPSGFGGFPEMTAKMATFPKEPLPKTEFQQQQQQQPPLFSQANYHERPRVLQLNNGSTLNLPNAEDYNRQLNDAQLQAQIKSYFEEMMAQMKLTQQMVQSSPQQQPLQQPPPPAQSPLLSGSPQQQQQPLLQHDQAQHSRMQQQQPLQLAGNTANQYSPLAQQYQQQPMTGQQAPVSGQYQAPSGFQQPPQQPFSAGTGGQYPQYSQQHQPSQLYPPSNSPSAVMTPQQAPPAHHPMSYPSAPSMQHLPSHNSIGNSSYIRPQATSSQLFPSLQPHPPPAMVSNQHHHHHPPRQQIKHHMPPQQLQQQQHRPQVIEGTFNQTGGGPFPLSTPQPTMGFPAFPPMTPVSRPITPKTKVGPAVDFFAPPPSSFFPPSQPPFPARLETPQVNQWQNFGGSGGGGFLAPTPPIANFPPPPTFGANNFPPCTPVFPTGFNFDASSGGKRDQVDCTNEQMEAIQRDIQELRKEIQDKEWNELMTKVRFACSKETQIFLITVIYL